MEIILFNNKSEINKISKTLVNSATLQGRLVNEASIINPTFIIEIATLTPYNYVYVPELNRYYFINESVIVRNNMWSVQCSVDVLMSFKNEILNLKAIIDKQELESQSNTYFDDGSYITENKTFIETIDFPNGFNENPEYVLITSGGGIIANE